MSIVKKLIRHSNFIERVRAQIASQIVGKNVDAYDSKDGHYEGTVTDYELTSDPKFDAPEGDGLEWSVPFEAHGEATIGLTNFDGDYEVNTKSGPCEGYVEIVFPPNTLDADIDEIVSDAEITTTVESADIEPEPPSVEEPVEEPEPPSVDEHGK